VTAPSHTPAALLASLLGLLAIALSPTFIWLALASTLLGIATVFGSLITPFAVSLASPTIRGSVVGTILTGVFLGILLARTVSGWMATLLGWRAVFWMAAIWMGVLAILVRFALPADQTIKERLSYRHLFQSLWHLVLHEPLVREASLFGGLAFAAFNAFWVTLAFFLASPPYHFGSAIAGSFGLVGAIGALAATFVGKLADRQDLGKANGAALAVMLFLCLLLWLTGQRFIGLTAGIVVSDMGSRANMTLNQARL